MSLNRFGILCLFFLSALIGACNRDQPISHQTDASEDAPLLDQKHEREMREIDANLRQGEKTIDEIDAKEAGERVKSSVPVEPSSRMIDDSDDGEIDDGQNPVAERVERETGELEVDLNERAEEILRK